MHLFNSFSAPTESLGAEKFDPFSPLVTSVIVLMLWDDIDSMRQAAYTV